MEQFIENPYLGPRPFEEHRAGFFFGRSREVEDLLALTILRTEVLLYSPAGAGKTSLLQAGLIPALRAEGFEVLPTARVGGSLVPAVDGAETNVYVLNTLLSWTDGAAHPNDLASMTLQDYLSRWETSPAGPEEPPPRVAIFDQFEELFTQYPEHWRRRRELIEQICEALEEDPRLRVIFAMREEYIASLDPYQSLFPERLRARFRLERLGKEGALEAVRRPGDLAGRPFHLEVAERIVEDLLRIEISSPEGTRTVIGEFIDPVQLQVVCRRLWESVPPDSPAITVEDLMRIGGVDIGVDQALSSFYEEALATTFRQTGVPQETLRRWFDRVLITPLGTRSIVLRGPHETGGIPNAAVEMLQNLHLVRAELRGGAVWYELAHDRLLAPIRMSNQRWLPEQGLLEMRQLEEKAEEWVRGGRRSIALLSPAEMDEAERWLNADSAESMLHGERLLAFLEANRWALEREKLLRQLANTRRTAMLAVWAGVIGVICAILMFLR
ncbi:MAG TPA: hypothetical protein VKM72_22045 [Thermoanaerobaculia bacterium]|nr:hypothetical protein [Thermoanaerobaculia bacterium]